nr:J domain-containing protein [Vibrio amylolyticus]
MKWLFSLSLLVPTLSFGSTISELTPLAEQHNVRAQFQLANLYETSSTQQDYEQALYWYLQAAKQEHVQSQFSLATLYLKGLGVEPDLSQALYWLTKLSLEGNIDAQVAIATIYEKTQEKPNNLDMAELWYLIAQPHSEMADIGYSRVLEAKFNQRKAQQVSSLDQLDIAFEPGNQGFDSTSSNVSSKPSSTAHQAYSNQLFVVIFIVISALISLFVKRRKNSKILTEKGHSETLAETVQSQAKTIKQQKRQMETLFKQVKRLQQPNQPNQPNPQEQKLAIACAIFGFQPKQLPDQKKIKTRYKQLSKVYHPDLSGSEDEMKRLNNALKIISTNLKQK